MADELQWIAVCGVGKGARPHEWRWVRELPSGWCAIVIDRSQCYNPPRPTEYHVAALRGTSQHYGRGPYDSLEVAKREALELALIAEAQGI